MRTPTRTLLALGTAAALGLAACGGGEDESTVAISGEARPAQDEAVAPEGEPAAEDAAPTEVESTVDDAASTLRAQLTTLLQEHVHLTGLAAGAVAEQGQDAPAAQAAVQALDENTTALGELIGGVPSADGPEAFLELWRAHVAAYVDHVAARAAEDDDAAAEAATAQEDLLQPMADLFEELTLEEVAAEDLFGELETHVTMVTDAVDARVAGDGEASDLLLDAALHMDAVAAELAAGIVAAHPDQLAGDPLGVPAETRAGLTSGLVEHTYLTLLAAGEIVASGGAADDPAVQAVVTTLDGSADGLANGVSGVSGNDGREAFLDLWRPFLTAATDYAAAAASGDAAAADAARSAMVGAPAALAEVFEQATAGNAPDDLTAQLDTHVTNLLAAIDAMVAGDASALTQARGAAQHASTIAAGLASGMIAAAPADTGGTDAAPTGSMEEPAPSTGDDAAASGTGEDGGQG